MNGFISKNNISQETIKEIENMDNDKFKKTEAYKKYVKSSIKRSKQITHQQQKEWWKNNWIGIVTLIATVLTLAATILFGLLQLLK